MMIPESVKKAVLKRSDGRCEFIVGTVRCNSIHMLDFAHKTHRRMGGRKGLMKKLIDHEDNILHLCRDHHDLMDGRIKDKGDSPAL